MIVEQSLKSQEINMLLAINLIEGMVLLKAITDGKDEAIKVIINKLKSILNFRLNFHVKSCFINISTGMIMFLELPQEQTLTKMKKRKIDPFVLVPVREDYQVNLIKQRRAY